MPYYLFLFFLHTGSSAEIINAADETLDCFCFQCPSQSKIL